MTPTTRTKRPTIRDVAAKAGVSKSLVSLVFSAPQTVSNYRKDLVLKAAEELGFSPNFLARSLAAETGTFIGILVADFGKRGRFQLAGTESARASLADWFHRPSGTVLIRNAACPVAGCIWQVVLSSQVHFTPHIPC